MSEGIGIGSYLTLLVLIRTILSRYYPVVNQKFSRYTQIVPKKQPNKETTELGRFLRRWREDKNLTVEEAAHQAGFSSKSVWTKIENGQKVVRLETLYGLSQLTGRTMDDLARMLGLAIRHSASSEERGRRIVALVDVEPKAAALVDLLTDLTPGQIDVMLSVGESLRQKD